MSISEYGEKIKPYYVPTIIVLVAVIFFGLGRLSAVSEKNPSLTITYPPVATSESHTETVDSPSQSKTQVVSVQTETTPVQAQSATAIQAVASQPAGGVIGVKTSKKYYFPWCGVIKRVKPENQVPFASLEDAQKAGYVAGGGCKGLK